MVRQIEQQVHGYHGGHQLLASSVALGREDQYLVDRLSDLSGPLMPGQDFAPYLTSYPLPSGSYYVVARTWQDKKAVRAGCVLTRSLLVPMQDWLDTPSLPFLLEALRPVDKTEPNVASLTVSNKNVLLPAVADQRTGELIEALFLEVRQPIVMFEVGCADIIIARLLTALWPGMRRQFSSCGMALAPRSLEGHSFDFLCAPKSSRLRFAEWQGRKISETAIRSSRHRWTPQTVDEIFQAGVPNLSTFDALGILRTDIHGDGSVLRIALLWNELLEKSKTSPNAVLGLLDVLSSQNNFIAVHSLLPTLSNAIDLSRQNNPVFEHLRYLMTLLGKFVDRVMPISLLRHVHRSAAAAAEQDPTQTLEFLLSADRLGRRLPRVFYAGLGDGLAKMANTISVKAFSKLVPETQIMLLSGSTPLAKWVLGTIPRAEPCWPEALSHVLEVSSLHLRFRVARQLVPELKHKSQAIILRGILHGAAWSLIVRIVDQLWHSCQFMVAEFDNEILRSAVHVQAVADLRRVLTNYPETMATDRFLLNTLQLDVSDIDWILTSHDLNSLRAVKLFSQLVVSSDNFALERVFSAPRIKRQALLRVASEKAVNSAAVARILLATGISAQEEFELGLAALSHANGSILQYDLARLLLQTFFHYVDKFGRSAPQGLLSDISAQLDVSEIILAATDETLSANQLNANIRILNTVPTSLRSSVLRHIVNLSERIMSLRQSFFDVEATRGWAAMIADSKAVDPRAQLHAAEAVLPFALKMIRGPASPLVVTTFPLVYAELARVDSATPSALSFFFSFGDWWDRCDVLRRGLVDAFMKSDWPPTDILFAAHAAGALEQILDIISRRHGGKDYLRAIQKDSNKILNDFRIVFQDAVEARLRN